MEPTLAQGSAAQAATSEPTDSPALERQAEIERQELIADLLRTRLIADIALILWPAFGLLDWMVVTWIASGDLQWYLGVRAVGWLLIGLGTLWLHRAPPASRRMLTLAELHLFGAATACITLMCLEYRGIASPYFGGVILVLAVRASGLAAPWRRALLLIGAPAAAFPVVLVGAAVWSEAVAAQLRDPEALATFAQSLAFIGGVVLFTMWGSHAAWSVRRQVFENRSLGRYRLTRRIGRGGMGEVWSAWHKGLRRQVAVKLLRPEGGTSPEMIARFEREVEATTALHHPNTVRVFDYGVTEDGVWYYAMELLDGCTLAELVRSHGPLAPERAVRIAVQGARALAEAHGQGIVHRDVKPENLYVTAAGGEPDFIKLLDFGIARVEAHGGAAALTRAQWVGGTPAWMSPEVAQGRPADTRSDVYSLGAVLYFMLVGRPPFEGNPAELMDAHAHRIAVPPSQRREGGVPADLEAVVLRCLAKDPAERFADGGALAAALAACASADRPAIGLR